MKLYVLLALLLTSLVSPFVMADDFIPESDALAADSMIDDSSMTADATLSATTDYTTTLATTFGSRKYRPGHYVALLRSFDSQTIMSASVKPGVVGFMKRYTWRSLEDPVGSALGGGLWHEAGRHDRRQDVREREARTCLPRPIRAA
jgi:hypothetical protein